jgi:hypothetical protein
MRLYLQPDIGDNSDNKPKLFHVNYDTDWERSASDDEPEDGEDNRFSLGSAMLTEIITRDDKT